MIRPNSYIGHNFKIHSHCYIAPGCTIGGGSEIKSLSFIGIGATVVDSITIERETLIGAGSLVLKNTDPWSQYFGSPQKRWENMLRRESPSGSAIEGLVLLRLEKDRGQPWT